MPGDGIIRPVIGAIVGALLVSLVIGTITNLIFKKKTLINK